MVRKTRRRDGCWVWTGATAKGYGQFGAEVFKNEVTGQWQTKMVRAHRWAWEQENGPVPTGLTLDHLCHDPAVCKLGDRCPHRACVRPSHLEPKTAGDNALRGSGPAAKNKAKTHCSRGHMLRGDNVLRRPGRTARECKTCHIEQRRVKNGWVGKRAWAKMPTEHEEQER